MADVTWTPISAPALAARIAQAEARMSPAQLRLWRAVRIEPVKWRQHPFGDAGSGFWAVALIGQTVLWYNDIEEGFNRSRYAELGTIADYWCNHDELEVAVQYLMNALEHGSDLVLIKRPAERPPR